MRKVLLPILYISLIAPILFGAFDAKAVHSNEGLRCSFSQETNVVTKVSIFKDLLGEWKLQWILPDGEKDAEIEIIDEKTSNKRKIVGKAIFVNILTEVTTDPPESLSVARRELPNTENELRTFCSNAGGVLGSVFSTSGVVEVICRDELNNILAIEAKDDFDGDGNEDGLNTEFLNESVLSSIVGLPTGNIINNQASSGNAHTVRVNQVTGINELVDVQLTSAQQDKIRHRTVDICAKNKGPGGTDTNFSVIGGDGGGSNGGGGGGGGGSGGGGSGGGGSGGGVGRTAQIQEGCNIGRKIQFKDSDTTVSFEENEFVGPGNDRNTGKWGVVCVVNTVNTITDWAFFILISVAFVFILIAGFLWMTGRGEAEKMKKAGQMIGAALVGIVIALLSRVIPGVITGILT